MTTYLFTLEIDVVDEPRLVDFARTKAKSGCDPDIIEDAADALQWLFDDNSVLKDAGYPAEIVSSSCERLSILERALRI